MSRSPYVIAASLALMLGTAASVSAQGSSTGHGRLLVVKLVTTGSTIPYAFEPATVTAQRGDTVRFVEAAGVLHNVHFKSHPSGSNLGSAASGPYLTAKGQKYDVVIDSRFTDGRYEFVCDPHETMGMKGVLTVESKSSTDKSTK